MDDRDFRPKLRDHFKEAKVIFGILKEQGLKSQVRGFLPWSFQLITLKFAMGIMDRQALQGND